MRQFEWSKKYETGIALIDEQHRELFSRIDSLLLSIYAGKEQQELRELDRFLREYVETHLRTEEGMMRDYGFPEYEDHVREHRSFAVLSNGITSELQRNGPSVALAIRVEKDIKNWWAHHILNTDMEYVPFLLKAMGQAGELG